MKNNLKILLLFFFLASFSLAQEYSFRNYTVEEGLIQSQVFDIKQDSQGYLWFATRGGISRFDGKNFRNITESEGLIDNRCQTLLFTSNSEIWAATLSGLTIISSNNLKTPEITTMLQGASLSTLCQEDDNTIWCGGMSGLFRISKTVSEKFTTKEGLTSDTVNFIFKDDDYILFATNHGITSLNKGKFKLFNISPKINKARITHIFKDKRNNYWLSSTQGAFYFDGNTVQEFNTSKGLINNLVNKILVDSNGDVWFATDDGISKYDGKSIVNFSEKNGLSNNRTNSLYEDKEGNIWFASYGGGVNKYAQKIFTNYSVKDGLRNNMVWAISEFPKGVYWLGSENGLTRFDGNNYNTFDESDGLSDTRIGVICNVGNKLFVGTDRGGFNILEKGKFTAYTQREGLVNNAVYSMDIDDEGNYWIGTREGLSKFDGKNFTNYTTKNGLIHDRINDLLVDREGTIWLGTDNGLNYIKNGVIHDFNKEHGLRYYSVMSVIEDKKGNIWFDLYGSGIFKYDKNLSAPLALKSITSEDGLENAEIYLMIFDKVGNLWIGTNFGVSKLDIDSFDSTGQIRFTHYAKSEGFVGIECNQNASFLDSDGYVWFGTIGGANRYNPDADKYNMRPPSTHITNLKLFFEDVDWQQIDPEIKLVNGLPQNITFSYNQNHISFEFVGISLTLPEKVVYKCKLEGFDKDWTPVSSDNSITYSNLPHGDYTFKVLAANNAGLWNTEPTTFSFSIDPPFWLTATFIIICSIITVLSVYVFILLRTKKLKEQSQKLELLVNQRTHEVLEKANELEVVNKKLTNLNEHLKESEKSLKKLNASKDKLFSIIAHDLKSPFTSLLGFTKLLVENTNDFTREEINDAIKSVNKSAQKVYTLLENLLDWSRIQIGGMQFQPEKIFLTELTSEAVALCEVAANNKKIQVIDRTKKDTIAFIDKNMVNTILRNLLTNAIKFSEPFGKIYISTEESEDKIIMCVEDEGVGISVNDIRKLFRLDVHHTTEGTANERGTGVGLILCKELVEKNKGTIWVESTLGKGSKFYFSVPKVEFEIALS